MYTVERSGEGPLPDNAFPDARPIMGLSQKFYNLLLQQIQNPDLKQLEDYRNGCKRPCFSTDSVVIPSVHVCFERRRVQHTPQSSLPKMQIDVEECMDVIVTYKKRSEQEHPGKATIINKYNCIITTLLYKSVLLHLSTCTHCHYIHLALLKLCVYIKKNSLLCAYRRQEY